MSGVGVRLLWMYLRQAFTPMPEQDLTGAVIQAL